MRDAIQSAIKWSATRWMKRAFRGGLGGAAKRACRIVVGASAFLAGAGIAQAADLSDLITKAPPPSVALDPYAQLASYGIYLKGFANTEIGGNLGGLGQGVTTSSYAAIGVDLDLQAKLGLEGTRVHAMIIGDNGQSLSQRYIGGGIDVQENFSPFPLVRFMELTIEQYLTLFHKNDLDLVAGRMGAGSGFFQSDYACQFMNHAVCGNLFGFSQDTGVALAPLATWGGRARFNATDKIYGSFGVFAIDPALFVSTVGLFNFNTNLINGYDYAGEVGYETNFKNSDMPTHIRLGGYWLDAPRSDKYLNSQSLPLLLNGGTAFINPNSDGMWLTGDQVIWRPSMSSNKNLAIFGSIFTTFQNYDNTKFSTKIGLVQTGTFDSRPTDTAGIVFSAVHFTDSQVAEWNLARKLAGGVGTYGGTEYLIEVNYGWNALPGVMFRPNVQYIMDPNPNYTPTAKFGIPNAWVFGLRIDANLADMFNLPKLR